MGNFRAAALAVAIGTMAVPASAAVVIFEMDFEFSGGVPPAGASPWMRATFDDGGGSGSVTLKMENINLTGDEFVKGWYFNLDPTLDPTMLSFSAPTKVGSFTDPSIGTGVDAFQADGDGKYDVLFSFATAGGAAARFGAGESVTYTISGIATLTALDFQHLSLPWGGHGPFYSAAHVLNTGVNGEDSGWVGATLIPEPSSIVSLGIITALGLLAARRRR